MASASTTLASDATSAPDYIIVGGGTAGLVVATRLTEDPNVRMLVVEAGAHRKGDPNVEIPGMLTQLYGNEKYDWNFMSEPQIHMNNRQIACPRGRLLGGSSGINFCAILYPCDSDFEAWTKLGNRGWNRDDMQPYFRKFQNHSPPGPEVAEKMRLQNCVDVDIKRDDGPLPITYLKGYGRSQQAWVESFAELGFDTPGDPIHGKKRGAFTNPFSLHPETMTRGYAANTFYNDKTAARPNLQVLTETTVKRIVLKNTSEGVVATGVEVLSKDGQSSTLSIKEGGEVILSAGVVKSPQMLELSGIGDEQVLRQHGITPIISNSNVGENLQDHPWAGMGYEVIDDKESLDCMREPENIMAAVHQYQSTQSGPLTGTQLGFAYLPLVDGNGIVTPSSIQEMLKPHLPSPTTTTNTTTTTSSPHSPQYKILQDLLLDPSEPTGEYMLLPSQLNVNPRGSTTMTDLFSPTTPGNYISLCAYLNRPFSRGSIHIRSASPTDDPLYDPNYLSHPLDLELLARQYQFLNLLSSTPQLQAVLKPDGRRIPAAQPTPTPLGLEEAKEIVKQRTFTAFHPCGTCAMMPQATGGVVDERLRVYGTTGLRVVDASVFPMVPVGNIQATVYAVAERAADLIKEDWAAKRAAAART